MTNPLKKTPAMHLGLSTERGSFLSEVDALAQPVKMLGVCCNARLREGERPGWLVVISTSRARFVPAEFAMSEPTSFAQRGNYEQLMLAGARCLSTNAKRIYAKIALIARPLLARGWLESWCWILIFASASSGLVGKVPSGLVAHHLLGACSVLARAAACRSLVASKPDEKTMTVNHSQHGLPSTRDLLPVFCNAHRLSQREREVLDLLIAGRAPKEIAGELCIAASTVRFHAVSLYKKCAVRGQREMLALVARVLRAGHA